jgi:hypothetical protein
MAIGKVALLMPSCLIVFSLTDTVLERMTNGKIALLML